MNHCHKHNTSAPYYYHVTDLMCVCNVMCNVCDVSVCDVCMWCVRVMCMWCVCACIYIGVSVCKVWAPLLACLCPGLPHPSVALGPSGVTGRQRRRALGRLAHGDFGPSPPYWACWPLEHNLASSGFEGLPEVPSGLGSILRLGTACWSVMSLKTAQPDLSGHQGWGYILGKAGLGEPRFWTWFCH